MHLAVHDPPTNASSVCATHHAVTAAYNEEPPAKNKLQIWRLLEVQRPLLLFLLQLFTPSSLPSSSSSSSSTTIMASQRQTFTLPLRGPRPPPPAEQRRPQQRQPGDRRNLDNLPPEVLFLITGFLPHSGHMSLSLVCRALQNALPFPPHGYSFGASSACERRAIWRFLGERDQLERGWKWCVLCRGTLQASLFQPAPHDAVCKLHEGRLSDAAWMPEPALEPALRERLIRFRAARTAATACWVAVPRLFCGHLQGVIGWDFGNHDACECRSCVHVPVTCHLRMPPARNTIAWDLGDENEEGGQCMIERNVPHAWSQFRIRVPIIPLDDVPE